MPKDLKISVLLDLYSHMLTDKQSDTLDYYYNQDLSLSEISEHLGITRQGVRDNIKRGEAALLELEKSVGLYDKYIDKENKVNEIVEILKKMIQLNNIQLRNSTLNGYILEIGEILKNLN